MPKAKIDPAIKKGPLTLSLSPIQKIEFLTHLQTIRKGGVSRTEYFWALFNFQRTHMLIPTNEKSPNGELSFIFPEPSIYTLTDENTEPASAIAEAEEKYGNTTRAATAKLKKDQAEANPAVHKSTHTPPTQKPSGGA